MKPEIINDKRYPVLIHSFENTRAVWFKNSGSFLLLEEPAYLVLDLFLAGNDFEQIKKICIKNYGRLSGGTEAFVDEIIQYIQLYNRRKPGSRALKNKYANAVAPPAHFQFAYTYGVGSCFIEINYANEWIKHIIHPTFSHLVINKPDQSTHQVYCYKSGNHLVVLLKNKIIGVFGENEVEYFKGAVLQLVYSIIYNISFNGWMCTLHASGVFSNNKAIVFSAAAGSGKSTVSAILKAKGFGFISDDFIAATPDGKVYPFPASISVKAGSAVVLAEYYPELVEKAMEKAATGKLVRYLPVTNNSGIEKKGIPVEYFIFIDYQENSGFNLSEVEKKEALQLLLKETWVNPKPVFVKAFFEWVEKTSFFRMSYSDTDKMTMAIKNLLSE